MLARTFSSRDEVWGRKRKTLTTKNVFVVDYYFCSPVWRWCNWCLNLKTLCVRQMKILRTMRGGGVGVDVPTDTKVSTEHRVRFWVEGAAIKLMLSQQLTFNYRRIGNKSCSCFCLARLPPFCKIFTPDRLCLSILTFDRHNLFIAEMAVIEIPPNLMPKYIARLNSFQCFRHMCTHKI